MGDGSSAGDREGVGRGGGGEAIRCPEEYDVAMSGFVERTEYHSLVLYICLSSVYSDEFNYDSIAMLTEQTQHVRGSVSPGLAMMHRTRVILSHHRGWRKTIAGQNERRRKEQEGAG